MPKDKSLKRKGDRGQNIIDFKEEIFLKWIPNDNI